MKDVKLRKIVGYPKDSSGYYTVERRLQYLEILLTKFLASESYIVERIPKTCGCCDDVNLSKK